MTTLRSIVLLALLAVSGCEKTNDLPRMQDEALATAKAFQLRFEDLAGRVEAIRQRAGALPAEVLSTGATGQAFRHALSIIEDHRRELQQLPGAIRTAVQAGKPEDLASLVDVARERLDRGMTEATSELSAVESAIAIAERRPAGERVPPEPDQGSAAPIR